MSVPGVVYPELKPLPVGANSPSNAALINGQQSTNQQMALLGTAHGGRRKRRISKGGTTTINVPTMQTLYRDTGAGDQTVNGNIMASTKIGASSAANSVYDACAGQPASCTSQVQTSTQKGGRKSRKSKGLKGGLKWGCYSGGKRKTRRSRRSKKSRKSRKVKK
jgi:hypothetical protein